MWDHVGGDADYAKPDGEMLGQMEMAKMKRLSLHELVEIAIYDVL